MSIDRCFGCGESVDTDIFTDCYRNFDGKPQCFCVNCPCEHEWVKVVDEDVIGYEYHFECKECGEESDDEPEGYIAPLEREWDDEILERDSQDDYAADMAANRWEKERGI
jgi:hypothetical protein